MNFNKNPVESLSSDLKTERDMRKVILFSEISLFLFKKLKKKGENPFYSFLFWGKMLSPYCLEPYGRCSKVPPPARHKEDLISFTIKMLERGILISYLIKVKFKDG